LWLGSRCMVSWSEPRDTFGNSAAHGVTGIGGEPRLQVSQRNRTRP
jgi:hypothetical protein